MNWLLIIVVLILAFSMIRGYKKGFLRMLYAMVSWIVMFFLVSWATPYVNTYLKDNTMLYQKIAEYCERSIQEKAQSSLTDQTQNFIDEQTGQVKDLGVALPDTVMNEIAKKTAEAAGDIVESSGIYQQIAYSLADFILNGISFFLTLGTAMIILHILSRMVGVVSRIPVIRGVNRYLGMGVGAIFGMVVVWIAFYLIALCGTSETGKMLIAYIYENSFLTYIYEHNFIITLVLLYL